MSFAAEMMYDFLSVPVGYLLAPIFFLDIAIAMIDQPQGRPSEDQCFVWIEDAETREVIDGEWPQKSTR